MKNTIIAQGQFLKEKFSTQVDSEVAKYYVEVYLNGNNLNAEIHKRIDEVYLRHSQTPISREVLLEISNEFSVDFSSLFFLDILLRDERNKKINESFVSLLCKEQTVKLDMSPYLVLFVPGWDYEKNGHLTGADFRQPQELAFMLGLENYLVSLHPTGSVEENAAVFAKNIHQRAQAGKKILIAGASSAGPAIHLALSELIDAQSLATVKAWLNLGGILQGSPLIDYLQRWPQRGLFNLVTWFKGWNKQSILSMATKQSRQRFEQLHIKKELLVVNYLGIPLSGQLSRFSRDKYPLLKKYGPNDGLTLLPDAIVPDSLTIVAFGSDHFFAEDPKIDEKTVALIKLIISLLEES